MATIFLDQFSGTGSINGHAPDIGVANAEWSDIGAPPSAQLVGGFLVAPEAGVPRVAAYEYRVAGDLQPIALPPGGTYTLTFRTGTSEEIAYSPGGNNTLFSFTIFTDGTGSTANLSVTATSTPGQFLFQGSGAALVNLEPETTYVLTWIFEFSQDRFSVSTTPPTIFGGVQIGRPLGAPYGFAFGLTEKADIDELQVTDDVPPPPNSPTDYFYDDFTGDGPMEGRTPDLVAIPGVVWADTSPTGSAVTLGGSMVVGPGVPTDGVASARYGDFATASGGPLTGDIYADFLTGPDLSYPVGATGPVTLVKFRFSVSPGTDVSLTLVVNPDGSFTALYGDGLTAPVTLTADTVYFLYINYRETEHYVELFDGTLGALEFSDTYPYTPVDPSAGYGATELSVNERVSIGYYEVYGLLQEPMNDPVEDGMDEGVAEDSTDTLNVVTEDAMEAGVGEDYPLLDGEVLPEDVREAGVGADAADTQLNANQDVAEAGVATDAAPNNNDSRYFIDEFNGTGLVSAHTPDRFYGPTTWEGAALLGGGLLSYDPAVIGSTNATYGMQGGMYATGFYGSVEFEVKTHTVPTTPGNFLVVLRIFVWGETHLIRVDNLPGYWQIGFLNRDVPAVPIATVLSNTAYKVRWEFNSDGFIVSGFGVSLRLGLAANTEPLKQIGVSLYAPASMERISASRDLALQFDQDAFSVGVAEDSADVFLAADVLDEAVGEGVADPTGGILSYEFDVVDEAVAADALQTSRFRVAVALSEAVVADFAPNDYYALPTEAGVLDDATNRAVLANQIARDAGVAVDAVDIRILEDVVEAAVAEDTTTTAALAMASSTGVADDRAPASTVVLRTVVEEAVAGDAAVGMPAYLENTVAMSEGVAADDAPNAAGALARDTGVADARALPSYSATQDVTEAAVGVGMASFSIQVDVVEEALAADVVTDRISLGEFVREAGVAEDATSTARATRASALAAGVADDATSGQLIANNTVFEIGVGNDAGLFAILYEAWVMNTQTTAMSRYSGLPFRSAAMVNGRLIGLGDDGFFEMAGNADDGRPVKAKMTTGFLRLGSDVTKRLDDITLGYVSDSTVKFGVTAYGPIKATYSYTSAARPAEQPRGTRVKPGKGLSSKYYQFSIENTPGAKVLFDYAAVDVADSTTRRI